MQILLLITNFVLIALFSYSFYRDYKRKKKGKELAAKYSEAASRLRGVLGALNMQSNGADEERMRFNKRWSEIQKSAEDEKNIGANYRPAKKGGPLFDIPANGVLYFSENNSIAWLKVRSDGAVWLFSKMADTGKWVPIRSATPWEVGGCFASAIPDDQALAIKAEEYRKMLHDCNYDGEVMIKNFAPL